MIGEAQIKLGEIRMDGEKTSRTVVAMDACSARRSEVGGEHGGGFGAAERPPAQPRDTSLVLLLRVHLDSGLLATCFYIRASIILQSI